MFSFIRLNSLQKWLYTVGILQWVAVVICLVSCYAAMQQWLFIQPKEGFKAWLEYSPISFERDYTAADVIGGYSWSPFIYIPIILLPVIRKTLLLFILLFGILQYFEVKEFLFELENMAPEMLREYIKTWLLEAKICPAAYWFLGGHILLLIYSGYLLFKS